MDKITKETTLSEILKLPKAEEVLLKYNVPCMGCPLAEGEMDELKIGDVAKMYQVDIKNLLKELNQLHNK